MRKNGGFQRVYREGERDSATAPDLVILRSTVRGFKKGSEMVACQVTTVSGATAITVHCAFADKDARLLLARDIKGYVDFSPEETSEPPMTLPRKGKGRA